jgi:hypothetical protein
MRARAEGDRHGNGVAARAAPYRPREAQTAKKKATRDGDKKRPIETA